MFRRFANLLGVAGLVALLASQSVSAAAPNMFSYQGRLTDPTGSPVPDGPNTITVRIWDDATSTLGVDMLWSSGTLTATTSDGLFQITLGQLPQPSFPIGLFSDTSLWLGITVAGDPEISPRSRLTAVPYALSGGGDFVLRAGDTMTGDLLWQDGSDSAVAVDVADHEIRTYGPNGSVVSQITEEFGFGQVKLYREGLADERVKIETTAGTGSAMRLYGTVEDPPYTNGITMLGGDGSRLFMANQLGTTELSFDMLSQIKGNSKVNLPDSAVSSLEMFDEPGLAHAFDYNSLSATSETDVAVDSVAINVPGPGFILVMVTGYISVSHITGTSTNGRIWVTESGLLDFDNFNFHLVDADLPSGFYYDGFALSMVKPVTDSGISIFRVAGDRSQGAAGSSATFNRVHTTAMYFPTSYGGVEATKSGGVATFDPSDPTGTNALRSEVTTITVEEHQALLRRIRDEERARYESRLADLEGRLESLENK